MARASTGEGKARVRPAKLSEIVARRLVRGFWDAELAPGTRLPPESEMVETFGIGRGSVREALRILEVHGVVSIRTGARGGPIIEDVGAADYARMSSLFYFLRGATYRDILEARLALDPLMARLAAARAGADGDSHRELQAALDAARAASTDDVARWIAASSSFHLAVAGMSGNAVLDLIGRALMHVWISRVDRFAYPDDVRLGARDDHAEIAAAITAGDGQRAEDLMRTHVTKFVRYAEAEYPGFLDEQVEWLPPGEGDELELAWLGPATRLPSRRRPGSTPR